MDCVQRLREAGLKATRPRQLVLSAFAQLTGHHSVDEVVVWLRQQGHPLPRGSVYGVVDDLTAKGLLQLADAGPGAALYELYCHDHNHFVCECCGAIFDVPTEAVELPRLDFAAQVSRVQLVIRGICQDCQPESSNLAN